MPRPSKRRCQRRQNMEIANEARIAAKRRKFVDEADKENVSDMVGSLGEGFTSRSTVTSAIPLEEALQATQEHAAQLQARLSATFSEICKPTWGEASTQSPSKAATTTTHHHMSRATVEDVHDEDESVNWKLNPSLPYGSGVLMQEVDFTSSGSTTAMNVVSPDDYVMLNPNDALNNTPSEPRSDNTLPQSPGLSHSERPSSSTEGRYKPPPSLVEAEKAWEDIRNLLEPRRKSGSGHLPFQGDDYLRNRLQQMRRLLYRYTHGVNEWTAASLDIARTSEKGPYVARKLREWTRAFISNRHALPYSSLVHGEWNACLLDQKPDLQTAIVDHLQSVGKYVRAQDIVDFLGQSDVQERFGLKRGIALSTAQYWMQRLDYRWMKTPSGQFVDGHEREDVVAYRNQIFLPALADLDPDTVHYNSDGTIIPIPDSCPRPRNSSVVYWFHDESTFYAHDRRIIRWVHKDEKAVPRQKGEGASLMVADFISADYGWLRSPDRTESARILFKAGANRDGWFTNVDVVNQTETAMDICKRHYPHQRHIFIFDNSRTHTKRPDDALSARRMSLRPTKEGNPLFGVDVKQRTPSGAETKVRVRMADAKFSDGRPQPLYFPAGHPRAGVFKGMAIILAERGIEVKGLRAECKDFKCLPPKSDCCCRRILYNQPDFRDVESVIEILCREQGFRALFLPKFHCELNPIEQCWGAAKREYRMCPQSSSESDLEKNVIDALDSIPLLQIRRFCIRSSRFMDAYRRGLTGKQAAWAAKKYHGHRVLPNHILAEMEAAGITAS